jgi:probable phosphomutase (TIGR03848 family)
MPLVLLIRHGENEYVKSGKLAGYTPGVHLNEKGQQQARALAESLAEVHLKAVYASSLERAVETAEPIAQRHHLEVRLRPDLKDNAIGRWQGRSWKALRHTKAWKVVQHAPSRFRFPEGESFMETQARVVTCLEAIVTSHKPKDVLAVVFHADPIKLAVAYYLGMPLDNFQRLACDTGSITTLMVGSESAYLLRMNQKPPFDFNLQNKKDKN